MSSSSLQNVVDSSLGVDQDQTIEESTITTNTASTTGETAAATTSQQSMQPQQHQPQQASESEREFDELCRALNVDSDTRSAAWRIFSRIPAHENVSLAFARHAARRNFFLSCSLALVACALRAARRARRLLC